MAADICGRVNDVAIDDRASLATVDAAHREFASLLSTVSMDDWERATPCAEWSVRDLVDHVIGAALIYTALLDGLPYDRAMSIGSAEVPVDADRHVGFEAAAARLRQALASPGALTSVCAVPGGSVSGAGLLTVRVFDVTVHCWDLARAIDGPVNLPPAIVEPAWNYAITHYPRDQIGEETGPALRPDDATQSVDALIVLTGRSLRFEPQG